MGLDFEWGIFRRWSLKGEYLFIQLEDLKYKAPDTSGTNYFNTKIQNQMSCLRCGFNLKF